MRVKHIHNLHKATSFGTKKSHMHLGTEIDSYPRSIA
jgi:hypothetical protein